MARNNMVINCGEGFAVQRGRHGGEADGGFIRVNNQTETVDLSCFSLEMLKDGPLADLINQTEGFKAIPLDKIGLLFNKP